MLKTELEQQNKQLQDENNQYKEKVDTLSAQVEEIKQMLGQKAPISGGVETILSSILDRQSANEEQIFIGSLDINGITISVNGRDQEVMKLTPFSQQVIGEIINTYGYRKHFENGVLYFQDPKWYDKFRIDPKNVLFDERIIGLFKHEGDDLIVELDKLTQSRTIMLTMTNLLFKIAILSKEGKLSLNLDQIGIVQDYFNADLQYTIKQLKFRKYQEN